MKSGERVLIIEDNEDVVTFLADNILHPHGYDTLISRDGQDGLQRALEENPDLILLDLNLPRMTGMEVLKVLQKRGSNIPVILMTFYGSEEIAVEAFRLGVKDYIVKPFKSQEVLDALEGAVGESRLRREKELLTEQFMQANKELEQRVRDLTILYKITQAMTRLVDLESLLSRVVEGAVSLSEADEGMLFLLDEETGELYLRSAKGVGEQYARALRMRPEDSLIGKVVETGEPLRVTSPEKRLELKAKSGYLVSSLLYVPLRLRDEIKGVLGVSNRVSERAFTAVDQHRLNILADHAVIALENSRLYAEEQRRASQLVMTSLISRRITSILDVDVLLSEVVELLSQDLGYYYSQILLRNGEAELAMREGTGEIGQEIKKSRLRVPIDDRSIVGWAANHGQPLCINDLGQEPRYQPYQRLTRTQAELAVPLCVGAQVIGVLDVHSERRNAFDDDQKAMLEILGDQVAIAIRSASSDEHDKNREDLAALSQMGAALSAALNQDEIVATTMRGIAELLDVEAASLLLVRDSGRELEIKGSIRGPLDRGGLPLVKMGQGIPGWVAQHGEPLIANDPSGDPRHDTEIAHLMGLEARSVLCVPLKAGDRVIGAIEIINKQENGADAEFSRADLVKLTVLASIVAPLLQHEKLKQAAVAEVSDAVRKTLAFVARQIAPPLQSIAATTYRLKASVQRGDILSSDHSLDERLDSLEVQVERLASLNKTLDDLSSSEGILGDSAARDRRLGRHKAKYPA